MTAADPAALEATLAEVVHEALLVEHFGKSEPHPAFRDPESDMGYKARRIAAHVAAVLAPVVAAEVARAKAETWDEVAQALAWAMDNGPDPARYVAEHNPYRQEPDHD